MLFSLPVFARFLLLHLVHARRRMPIMSRWCPRLLRSGSALPDALAHRQMPSRALGPALLRVRRLVNPCARSSCSYWCPPRRCRGPPQLHGLRQRQQAYALRTGAGDPVLNSHSLSSGLPATASRGPWRPASTARAWLAAAARGTPDPWWPSCALACPAPAGELSTPRVPMATVPIEVRTVHVAHGGGRRAHASRAWSTAAAATSEQWRKWWRERCGGECTCAGPIQHWDRPYRLSPAEATSFSLFSLLYSEMLTWSRYREH